LLIFASGAWAATITIARAMTGMTGTMGLGLAAFMALWTLMMAAMMLPSVAPVALLYATTVPGHRTARVGGLVAGYLAVWAAAGLPAYGLALLTGWLPGQYPGVAHVLAVAVLTVGGVYRLSGLQTAPRLAAARRHGPVFQYVMPGNCSRACSSWPAHSRGQPKARAAWPLMSAATAPLVKWTYSPQFMRRV